MRRVMMPELKIPMAVVNPKMCRAGVELRPMTQKAKLLDRKPNVVKLKLKSSFSSFV